MILFFYVGVAFVFVKITGLSPMPWSWVLMPFWLPWVLALGAALAQGVIVAARHVRLPRIASAGRMRQVFGAAASGAAALAGMYLAFSMIQGAQLATHIAPATFGARLVSFFT